MQFTFNAADAAQFRTLQVHRLDIDQNIESRLKGYKKQGQQREKDSERRGHNIGLKCTIKINVAIVTLVNASHEAPTIDDDLVEISARRTRNSDMGQV
jgi:hypothetical protein